MLHFLVIESELFICLLICLSIIIIKNIVKQNIQIMHVNCLSHFIIINASHQYKTKLYQYNTLLM
jgi:hypothetical protein